jgi:ribonuclease BN (tRNA processing enzyme)
MPSYLQKVRNATWVGVPAIVVVVVAVGLGLVVSTCAREASRAAEPEQAELGAESDRPADSSISSAKVVLLGTGGPPPDPKRSGPSAAVVSKGRAYLVDFGPGVVRRAVKALQAGIRALHPRNLNRAFVTHLHSDHTAGFPDLVATPPSVGRTEPLEVYGPPGLEKMTRHVLIAYEEDREIRTAGLSPEKAAGYLAKSHEVAPGVIYRDDAVTVTAFSVRHGGWKHAYGYRFDADGRTIVFSGDTAPSDEVVNACSGCDVLVHEVYCEADIAELPVERRSYYTSHHTSTPELAALAKRAKPRLLVLNHLLLRRCTPGDLELEIARFGYSGRVVVGTDLGVY